MVQITLVQGLADQPDDPAARDPLGLGDLSPKKFTNSWTAALRAAEAAYLGSGGSFRALLVSLLSSDSFVFRKEVEK